MKYFLLILLIGCSTTKDISKSEQTTNQLQEKIDSIHYLNSELATLTSTIIELQYAGVTFDSSRCPPSIINVPQNCNVDSILALLSVEKNKVKIYANGTIEAEGKLKSAYYSKDKLTQFIQSLQKQVDSLRLVKDKTQYITATKTVTKHKETRPLWWLYVVFFAGGFVWAKQKQIRSFLKNNI